MALNPFFADATVETSLAGVTALLNSGYIEIYDGSQPADANTAISTQTLLATLTLGATAFGNPVASGTAPSRVVTATANAITPAVAGASGTATWFRAYRSDNTTVVMDGSVGTSGCDLNLNSVSITAGDGVSVTQFTITQPE